jgi:MFS family permease
MGTRAACSVRDRRGEPDVSQGSGSGTVSELTRLVRFNTGVLAACLTLSWAVVQLLAAFGAVTLSTLTGRPAIAGIAPATFLGAWAVATLLVGRFMDARGRAPGLRLGFLLGAVGSLAIFVGTRSESVPLFLIGMAVTGGGVGAVNLARSGAADMYPAERRGRGISYVLIGAAFGAILGPIAFTPLVAGSSRTPSTLAAPWLPAAAVLLLGAALTLAIRVDPIVVARRLHPEAMTPMAPVPVRRIGVLLRVPMVRAALFAAVLSQAVMSTMMSIVGVAMVKHGHRLSAVEVATSFHFLGMFGLVIFVGRLVDRFGRDRAVLAGMAVLAAGCLGLLAGLALGWVIPAMFAIGLGWNVSFVAATAMLADATEPRERARLLGFVEFVAIAIAAVGSVVAGAILGTAGLDPMVLVAAGLALLPVLLFLASRPGRIANGPVEGVPG